MKKWLEPLSTAWVGIVTHKLRSSLTILGIVIGVAAVISLMSIGKGAEADILARIETLGADVITISPGASIGFGGVRGAGGSAQTLTQEDAEATRNQIAYIDLLSPTYSTSLQLIAGAENMNSQITGILPEYREIQNLKLASGAFFTDYEYERGAKVAVLGSSVKETLFPDGDPIGQQIVMGGNIVRVIGVLESMGGGFRGFSDSNVFIPLTAMQQMVAQPWTARGERVVSSIVLTVSDKDQTDYVVEQIASLLRTLHGLSVDVDNDFSIRSMEELAETITETSSTLTLLLGAIAAISLLVGGIGVMNIMLVSVLERTREIGILKALGAKKHHIWLQFLIEAAFMTLSGGIIGVAVGWVASHFVSTMGEMTTVVTADIVVLAVSVSVGIGLFFGFYPAWNASRLNPIEALRSE